jgi:hypothetical protein
LIISPAMDTGGSRWSGKPPAVYDVGPATRSASSRGFEEGLTTHGFTDSWPPATRPTPVSPTAWTGSKQQLPERHRPGGTQRTTLGPLLDLLRARGRRVPEDISVVTLCPRADAIRQSVQLTSMDIPAAELGELAVRMVMETVTAPRGFRRSGLIEPQLVERRSCAAPAVSPWPDPPATAPSAASGRRRLLAGPGCQITPVRSGHPTSLGPGPTVQFGQHVVDHVLLRTFGVSEVVGDPAGVVSLGQQPETIPFPGGQGSGRGRGTAGRVFHSRGQHTGRQRRPPLGRGLHPR